MDNVEARSICRRGCEIIYGAWSTKPTNPRTNQNNNIHEQHNANISNNPVPLLPNRIYPIRNNSSYLQIEKKQTIQKKTKTRNEKRIIDGAKIAILISALSIIFEQIQITQIAILPTLIIFGIIPKHKKIIGAIIAITGIIISPTGILQKTTTTFVFIVFIYGTIKLMLSLRPLLETTVKIKDLKEGMIPTKTLYYEKGKVKEHNFTIKGIFEEAKKNKLNALKPKNIIISSTKARGLIESEIKELKKLLKAKKIGETINIKDSMPFVPTMLIGYILCIILGDFWILFW